MLLFGPLPLLLLVYYSSNSNPFSIQKVEGHTVTSIDRAKIGHFRLYRHFLVLFQCFKNVGITPSFCSDSKIFHQWIFSQFNIGLNTCMHNTHVSNPIHISWGIIIKLRPFLNLCAFRGHANLLCIISPSLDVFVRISVLCRHHLSLTLDIYSIKLVFIIVHEESQL